MKTFGLWLMLILAFGGLSWAETYEQALGQEGVTKVIAEVTEAVVAEAQRDTPKREIRVQDSFRLHVVSKVGSVHTNLDKRAARWRLRGLYGVFLSHLIDYLGSAQNEAIELSASTVEKYIEEMIRLKRCGEIPCPLACPPCTKECDPCKG